jgi:two-component sensor histidine kinase
VQAIARQTLRHEEVSEQAWTVFEGRLNAMGRAHTLLMQQNWDKADLKDIMREMARNDLRLAIDGPPVRLPARLAVNLSMALHELYTNATKYGALSAPGGRISISWDIVRDQRLVLQWIETGGPRVTKPSRSGFGTRMINLAIAGEAGGSAQIDFKDTGVACRIQAPLHLEQSDHMRGSGPG